MTTYHTITLTTEQAHRILDLLPADPSEGTTDWAIEREIDGVLLAYEMEFIEPPALFDSSMGISTLTDEQDRAMDLSDNAFEARIEAGDTWSR